MMQSSCVPSQEMNLLFSLQELCLLYLVGHLDKYTPDILSLLPAHLRHQLLCRLPALDLHKLESTPVARGLDVSTCWQALYDYIRKMLYPECEDSRCYQCPNFRENIMPNKNRGPKESVMRLAASHMVQELVLVRGYFLCTKKSPGGISQRLNAILFCLPEKFPSVKEDSNVSESQCMQAPFELTGLYYYDSALGLVIPSRLTSFILVWKERTPDCALSLMKVLLDCFSYRSHYVPMQDVVHLFFGYDSSKWMIVEKYLSQAETICCSYSFPLHNEFDSWKNILRENFCAEDTRLSNLVILSRDHFSLPMYIDLFSQYLGCPPPTVHLPTYKGLKELVVHTYRDESVSIKSADQTLYKLAAMIDNQEQLTTLTCELQGFFQATPQSDAVMMAIARLMEKSCMEEVKICGTRLNIAPVSKVVSSYLFTPTSHEQVFELLVRDVSSGFMGKGKKVIDTHFTECRYSTSTSTIDGQCMKSLSLDLEQLPSLFAIFSKVPVPVTLKTIELTINGPAAEKHSLLPNLAAHSVILNFKEKRNGPSLHYAIKDYTTLEVGATGRALILNNRINHLCVSSSTLPIPSLYLKSLGSVIMKHAEQFQSLQSIKISNGRSKEVLDPNNFAFCKSLISLAQVVPLELRLEHMMQHLRKLIKVWKENKSIKKFAKIVLVISNSNADIDEEETTILLDDIAESSSVINVN